MEKQNLRVKCGFFFDKTIAVDSIKQIKETSNALSAPAASLSRLVISYNKFGTVIISPKHKEAFIRQLVQLNPSIEVIIKGIENRPVTTVFD